jgi:hypothetical protein
MIVSELVKLNMEQIDEHVNEVRAKTVIEE